MLEKNLYLGSELFVFFIIQACWMHIFLENGLEFHLGWKANSNWSSTNDQRGSFERGILFQKRRWLYL